MVIKGLILVIIILVVLCVLVGLGYTFYNWVMSDNARIKRELEQSIQQLKDLKNA